MSGLVTKTPNGAAMALTVLILEAQAVEDSREEDD